MFESKNAGGWALALVASGLFIGLVMRDLVRKESAPTENTQSIATMIPAQGDNVRGTDELTALFERVATQCTPFIVTLQALPSHSGAPSSPENRFSGVLMSPEGYILTTARLSSSTKQIAVTLSNKKSFIGEVLGSDPLTEVAVVKIAASGLKGIRQGNSEHLRPGQWVLTIGNTSHERQAVTAGIVSMKGRGNRWLVDDEDFLQTDAIINEDNDGGALVDLQGRLVGLNTKTRAHEQLAGLSRAIPVNLAREVMRRIITEGKFSRGSLGVHVQDLDAQLAKAFVRGETTGVLLAEVYSEGAAAHAGLQRGDLIVQYGAQKVANTQGLRELIASGTPGDTVALTVLRDKKELVINAVLDEQRDFRAETAASFIVKSPSANSALGFVAAALTPAILHERRLPANTNGVLVSEVFVGSPADFAGIRAGDIIQEWDRRQVSGLKDFRARMNAAQPGAAVVLFLKRGERGWYRALTMPESSRTTVP